jgi:hypothetical protein
LERGIFDGNTPDEIAQKTPEEFAARAADKMVSNFFLFV